MDDVEDLMLAACLEDQCYDRQCEGSRAGWMYGLFKDTPAYPRMVEPILTALARSTDDNDGDQLRELASLMAGDGDLRAAAALRSFVWAQTFSAKCVLGAVAICALDGIAALIEMARRLGKVVQEDPDAWVDTLDRLIDDTLPLDAVLAELKRVAPGDEAVAAYLAKEEARIASEAAQDWREDDQDTREQRRRDAFMSENPVDAILAAASRKTGGRYKFMEFGRWAGTQDKLRVLGRLRAESDPQTCENLLWVFRRGALPHLDERVWALASHSVPDVRYAAVVALSGISDPRIRELGRERLSDPGFSRDHYEDIELFKHNYQPGDETLILAALQRLSVDGDDRHGLGSTAVDVCTSARSPALAGVAQWVYRTSPCAICRREAVTLLLEWGSLPASIAAECRYDALEDLRTLVAHRDLPVQERLPGYR